MPMEILLMLLMIFSALQATFQDCEVQRSARDPRWIPAEEGLRHLLSVWRCTGFSQLAWKTWQLEAT